MPILVGPLGTGFYLIAMFGCILTSFFSLCVVQLVICATSEDSCGSTEGCCYCVFKSTSKYQCTVPFQIVRNRRSHFGLVVSGCEAAAVDDVCQRCQSVLSICPSDLCLGWPNDALGIVSLFVLPAKDKEEERMVRVADILLRTCKRYNRHLSVRLPLFSRAHM